MTLRRHQQLAALPEAAPRKRRGGAHEREGGVMIRYETRSASRGPSSPRAPGRSRRPRDIAGLLRCLNLPPVRSMNLPGMAFVATLAISLAGCGQFYWGKPGGTSDDFVRDNTACALEASKRPGGQVVKEVFENAYRQCLRDRGYVREQKVDPGPGWHRGIE